MDLLEMARIPDAMMMFWFLIVMLAAAWGIVGHLQENLAKMPRPAPAQIVLPSVPTGAPALPQLNSADDDAVKHASADGDSRPLDKASSTETPRQGDQCFGKCE
ncbi:MAG TPA: hypothetical protein PKZ67_05395 [Accumulibacter sp.]|uniref:Uncharacterized protein n=1 Tax=Candidatus Accumulibacter cognatus TaxID=2954383 RepID=A0A080MC80_9PROT|nr:MULTISPECIES: hypothetical protein [Candidatus Accumulibacter]MCC2867997.1 hypothetical protein [Candidatus Accumulibacter phosphatis]KFB74774.1 MAG: hypothetical protein AW06_004274 [Candidatus Accumulibacter cognatus]MBL8401768.1 hypothetical protein [Accumulibacter sp.]MBN8518105.1 hypothetical protein [Accumulibacter sp.]MBO3709559.1 hypothetical protein [Accumulibacter sp.]